MEIYNMAVEAEHAVRQERQLFLHSYRPFSLRRKMEKLGVISVSKATAV